MMKRASYFCLSFTSLLLILISAPSFADDAHDDMAKDILSMTADATCDDDSQCKSIGLGDKACGGFLEYRVYSVKSLDETALIAKVTEYNRIDKENNLTNNMASTCDILLQPKTSCVESQCTTMPVNGDIH